MVFTPAPGEILSINTQTLTFDADPANPAQVFRIQGRTAAVYRLSDPQGRQFALKVFSLAYRSPRRPEQAAAMAAYASLPGLNAAQRTVILPVEHAELVIRYPELRYAVLMPWLPGKTWEALKPKWATVFLERRKKVAVSLAGVLSCLEKQGLAHRNLSAANLLIDDDQIYLVDLESMLLPGGETENVPAPEDTAYRHPVDEAPARGRTADRYAGALLLSEIMDLVGNNAVLQGLWGEIPALFETALHSASLNECPSLVEWDEAIKRQVQWMDQTLLGLVSNGVLPHTEDEDIKLYPIGPEAADFILEAEFENPYSAKMNSWDYGFQFRKTDQEEYALVIDSEKSYSLLYRTDSSESDWITEGHFNGIDNSDDGSNHIKLTAIGKVGQLWINGDFVTELDLSADTSRGEISILTGFFDEDEVSGEETRFSNVFVWATDEESPLPLAEWAESLPLISQKQLQEPYLLASVTNGVLPHSDDEHIKLYPIGSDVANFILEAEFENPYSTALHSWDLGITFRENARQQYFLAIDSDKDYFLCHTIGLESEWILEDHFDGIDNSDDGRNQIKLTVIGKVGQLWINGDFVTELDLSADTSAGEISVGTGYFYGNEMDGQETRFSNVFVWAAGR